MPLCLPQIRLVKLKIFSWTCGSEWLCLTPQVKLCPCDLFFPEYQAQVVNQRQSPTSYDYSTLEMMFHFPTATHDVRNEYEIYDFNSLIADIGGYLGLLLGHSILSVFYSFGRWTMGWMYSRFIAGAMSACTISRWKWPRKMN